ncbi:HEPN domain-containing protein [Streptacidiphilus rugosus]|uniref:HEPN domain-containing protein n=1 Tax=Streptacidiphilus rugosus TaxID=405783 RepID=UPI0012FB8A6C|nr:MAE_28990/MAE_18760 family HEPN-like nuclease [Streptacidiphilus rugosus]
MTRKKANHSAAARAQVDRLKKSLEDLYIRADPRSIDDPEIASDLGRYLCVRVSGFLEQATQVILREYCTRNAWGEVQSFAHSWLDRMPNLSSDAFVKLVKRFNATWANELDGLLAQEERRASLNALIGIRNDVAHGKQQGMSRQQAWEYYELAEEIIEWLMERFGEKAQNSVKQ